MKLPGWLRVAFAMFVVGWGANQFTPLLLVYRATDHYSQTLVTSMFAAYVLGLVPALLLSAELAGRFGHRAVLRPIMVLTAISSLLLAIGESSAAPLFVGRVLYGVCTGAAMAPGTTWVKELSADAPVGTGARRATIALSAGFGGGAFLVGFMAEWLPEPKVLPYAVHIALAVLAGVLVWNAPSGGPVAEERRETTAGPGSALASTAPCPGREESSQWHSRHFWTRIAPMAAWVFAAPSISMVILPPLIKAQIGGFAVAFTGIVCGLTLGTGVLVQQPARHLEARRPGGVTVLGMLGTLAGVLLTVWTAGEHSVVLVVVASVVLGAGYGMTLVGGLTAVERSTPARELAMTNAVFYSLTYAGFAVPTIVSVLVEHWPERFVLLGLAALAALSLTAALRAQRTLSLAG